MSDPGRTLSLREDEDGNLLTGGDAIGVEAGLAHLTVSSPRGPDGKDEEVSILEALPLLVKQ